MEKLFINLVRMSVSASYLILAVLTVRLVLRRAPKRMRSFLWLLVGIRLVIPFSVESIFSLIPSTQAVDRYIYETAQADAAVQTPVPDASNPAGLPAEHPFTYPAVSGTDKGQTVAVCTGVWLVGVVLMLGYMLFSSSRIRSRVRMAVPTEVSMEIPIQTLIKIPGKAPIKVSETTAQKCQKVYQSSAITSPFLFGIAHPRIYIPDSISREELPYVIRHELAHRQRRDYLIKPAGFQILSLHWFNPCVWAAYLMLCRDIELICDERVVRELGAGHKKAYSQALLNSAANRRMIAACPVAFGEPGVKARVKNVLHYKKPAFWLLAAAVLTCIVVPLCFMTQKKNAPDSLQGADAQSEQVLASKPIQMRGGEKLSDAAKIVEQWARAFCDRDAETIVQLAGEDVKRHLTGQELLSQSAGEEADTALFGWSSPWPWGGGEGELANNYHIVSATKHSAEILYYAWVSDPHVTVWREELTYEIEEGGCVITSETLQFMDAICIAEEFYRAYPDGITGTMMDYYSFNGAGEALNQNAREDPDNTWYQNLFEPDTAAAFLLNILNNPNKVGTRVRRSATDADVCTVTFTFYEDNSSVSVQMIRPYGSDGIWLPYTDAKTAVSDT